MSGNMRKPPRIELAPGLTVSRVVTGLWQIADMERDGAGIDLDAAARDMAAYAADGFDTFDMADHYGSAEDIAGKYNALVHAGSAQPGRIFTKWCPAPGRMDPATVRAGVTRALKRLQAERVDLMQLHWWMYEHPAYLDAMGELARLRDEGLIGHLGTTNFDTDHLHLLAGHGVTPATNQVCFSLLDRRAGEDMSRLCHAHGIKLLAYGTLAGGLLTDRWRGKPEPAPGALGDWSQMKYKRFVDHVGGWAALQAILACLNDIARKHGVSIANVATRWVLEQPAVGAVIIGARLGEREHRGDNLKLFSFELDTTDHAAIDAALAQTKRLPGDCGTEYRRPPFLTASGDLSHHLDQFPKVFQAVPMDERPNRLRVDTGNIWEPICGYSRAVRIGNRILVSGTTATHSDGNVVAAGDARGQAVYILDKIAASVAALGGRLEDVVRTRIYLKQASDCEAVSHVHGRFLGHVRPANTLVEVSNLIGDYLVEIEAEAMVD